jgi:hypothetical protein
MNSTKGVIRIIKLASNQNEYDEYYYFVDVTTDINGHLMARNTSNIWDATKFMWNSFNDDENKRINSLLEFVKICYTPKKRYQIDFVPITVEFNHDINC